MMDPWVDASKIIQVDVRAVNYEQTTISTRSTTFSSARVPCCVRIRTDVD